MAMTMDIEGRIVERREPRYVGFHGAGQNVSLNGHIAIAAGVAGGSDCTVIIDAEPKGPPRGQPSVEVTARPGHRSPLVVVSRQGPAGP